MIRQLKTTPRRLVMLDRMVTSGQRAKRDAIARDMRTHGWRGQPLLGVADDPDRKVYLLTGSHRVAAARIAKLPTVPVYVLDAHQHGLTIDHEHRDVLDADGYSLIHASDDERLDAMIQLGDLTAIQLMDAEVVANAEALS